MMEVATKNHNLNDQRREVFLERLDKCSFQRFCELAQEGGKMTYGTIREAETFLQAEFLDLIEDGSIRRPTEAEVKSGNTLDGRFKVGLLNGQSDTKNKQWTDGDSKVLVEEKIMRYHAAQIASQEGKKGKDPGITTAYEQGKRTGMKIVEQKYKNVKSESPHSPNAVENILHLTNLLDLPLSESQQAKQGIKDGIIETIAKNKKDIAMKYGIPEEAISAENVMSNTLIMNDDYTIPRIE